MLCSTRSPALAQASSSTMRIGARRIVEASRSHEVFAIAFMRHCTDNLQLAVQRHWIDDARGLVHSRVLN